MATFTLFIESVSVPPNPTEHPLHCQPVYHRFEFDGALVYKTPKGFLALRPVKGLKLNQSAKETLIELLETLPEVRRCLQIPPFFRPFKWKESYTGTSKKMWRIE